MSQVLKKKNICSLLSIGGGAWRLAKLEPHLNYELDSYSLEGLDLFYQTNIISV
jgi:hypothetical protein